MAIFVYLEAPKTKSLIIMVTRPKMAMQKYFLWMDGYLAVFRFLKLILSAILNQIYAWPHMYRGFLIHMYLFSL